MVAGAYALRAAQGRRCFRPQEGCTSETSSPQPQAKLLSPSSSVSAVLVSTTASFVAFFQRLRFFFQPCQRTEREPSLKVATTDDLTRIWTCRITHIVAMCVIVERVLVAPDGHRRIVEDFALCAAGRAGTCSVQRKRVGYGLYGHDRPSEVEPTVPVISTPTDYPTMSAWGETQPPPQAQGLEAPAQSLPWDNHSQQWVGDACDYVDREFPLVLDKIGPELPPNLSDYHNGNLPFPDHQPIALPDPDRRSQAQQPRQLLSCTKCRDRRIKVTNYLLILLLIETLPLAITTNIF